MEDHSNDWYSEAQATFGDRVAGAREAAGLDQETLAQQLGVKLTTLMDWEDDVSEPRSNKLQMLSGLLNVSITWLLTGEGVGVASPEAPADKTVSLDDLAELRCDLMSALRKLDRLEFRLREAPTGD